MSGVVAAVDNDTSTSSSMSDTTSLRGDDGGFSVSSTIFSALICTSIASSD